MLAVLQGPVEQLCPACETYGLNWGRQSFVVCAALCAHI